MARPTRAITHYDDKTIQLAYETWLFEAGRVAAETCRRMLANHKVDIPESTMRHWIDARGWTVRADNDLNQFAPAMRREAAGHLIVATLNAARRILALSQTPMDKDGREEVKALALILDRGGFSPVGTTDRVAERSSSGNADLKRGIYRYLSIDDVKKITEGDE